MGHFPEDDEALPAPARGSRPSFTREEIQAALAAESTESSAWRRISARSGMMVVPVGTIHFAFRELFGAWAPLFVGLAALAAIAWIVAPSRTTKTLESVD